VLPRIRKVALQAHSISIIRTGIQTVLPWRPHGCNSSPCLALLRIASRRCRPDIRKVPVVFPYLCLWRKSFYLSNIERCPDGIATSSGWMHLNAGFFWNFEKRLDMLLICPDGCKLEQLESSRHWWAFERMTGPSRQKLGIWFYLTWKLHRIFFERWEAHFWNEDSEINVILDHVATLHKSDFVK
jgi:hypothetical protein